MAASSLQAAGETASEDATRFTRASFRVVFRFDFERRYCAAQQNIWLPCKTDIS